MESQIVAIEQDIQCQNHIKSQKRDKDWENDS